MFRKFLLLISLFCFSATSAHALDKKVALMFKTAGYGAAAGLLVGAATWTMGGPSRNALIGTSLGLYAGIILGTYILITQDDGPKAKSGNPWRPGQPVGPDDWRNEPLGEDDLSQASPDSALKQSVRLKPAEVIAWSPLLSISF